MKRSRSGQSKSASRTRTKKSTPKKGSSELSGDGHSTEKKDDQRDHPSSSVSKATGNSANHTEDEERSGSPDPNCSICLSKMDDKSFTHSCFHMFCFTCLLEWSKVKAVCPLCKQPFKSIIHNVRSESDYDVYDLKDNASVATAAPSASTDNSLPPELLFFGGEGRLATSYPWHGIMPSFEYLSGYLNTAPPTWLQFPSLVFSGSEIRRRVYETRRRAREIQLPEGMTYRDISPAYFATNLDSDHSRRLVIWLNRELEVLCPGSFERRRFIQELIMNMLEQYHIQSEDFFERLHQYFRDRTRLFINELYNFARSPLGITDTDRLTIYEDTSTPAEVEVITLDRDDSDVEIVSPPVRTNAYRFYNHSREPSSNQVDPFLIISPIANDYVQESALRLESPVAGPSGLPGGARESISLISGPEKCNNSEPHVQEVSDCESSSTQNYDNEIMVVGFDKPWRARTPISLSSDASDIEVDDGLDCKSLDNSPTSSSTKKSPSSQESWTQIYEDCATKMSSDSDESARLWDTLGEAVFARRSDRGFYCHSDSFSFRAEHYLTEGSELEVEFNNFGRDHPCCHCSDNCLISDGGFHGERYRRCREKYESKRGEGRKRKHKDRHNRDEKSLTKKSWSVEKHSRKRRYDDCGDSGVIVDVEQFCDSSEPSPKKLAYKKHCRGHKSSSKKLERTQTKQSRSDNSRDAEITTLAADARVSDKDENAELNVLRAMSSDVVDRKEAESTNSANFQSGGSGVDEMKERRSAEELGNGSDQNSSSSSSCDKVDVPGLDAESLLSNRDRGAVMEAEARESKETADESLVSQTAAGDESCVIELSLPAGGQIDSIDIDSEDSIQWLDSVNPELKEIQRSQHTSLCSRVSSPSSDILQLSDDDDSFTYSSDFDFGMVGDRKNAAATEEESKNTESLGGTSISDGRSPGASTDDGEPAIFRPIQSHDDDDDEEELGNIPKIPSVERTSADSAKLDTDVERIAETSCENDDSIANLLSPVVEDIPQALSENVLNNSEISEDLLSTSGGTSADVGSAEVMVNGEKFPLESSVGVSGSNEEVNNTGCDKLSSVNLFNNVNCSDEEHVTNDVIDDIISNEQDTVDMESEVLNQNGWPAVSDGRYVQSPRKASRCSSEVESDTPGVDNIIHAVPVLVSDDVSEPRVF